MKKKEEVRREVKIEERERSSMKKKEEVRKGVRRFEVVVFEEEVIEVMSGVEDISEFDRNVLKDCIIEGISGGMMDYGRLGELLYVREVKIEEKERNKMKVFEVSLKEEKFEELKRRVERMLEMESTNSQIIRECFFIEEFMRDSLDLRDSVTIREIL